MNSEKKSYPNPSRERDALIADMLGISLTGWYQRLSPPERKMYRNMWNKTTEEDKRDLRPLEWQEKYLGCLFIPPSILPTTPEYYSDGHGNIMEKYPDGKTRISTRDGDEIIQRPDGVRIIKSVDDTTGTEWEYTTYPNGDTRATRRPPDGRRVAQLEEKNGIMITTTTEGTVETQYPNGTIITRKDDGEVTMSGRGRKEVLASGRSDEHEQ